MTRLILSTSNIMTGGPSIIRKSGAERSNIELINSLRSNLRAAQQDYTPPPSSNSSNRSDSPVTNDKSKQPASPIWTTRDGSDYYVPTIDWSLSGLAEERSQYDITVKLFYLPGASPRDRGEHTRHAINLVLKELRIETIDLFIVSFPGMSFKGDCEWEADKQNALQGNFQEEIETWPVVEELFTRGIVKKLGLAEFGSQKLAKFLTKVTIRPEVDQINVRDCCDVPPPLLELAKKENIELLTHRDCSDILPSGTLRELLGQDSNGAGVLTNCEPADRKSELVSQWVVKYTAVVQDRGVVENKGYFAVAEFDERWTAK